MTDIQEYLDFVLPLVKECGQELLTAHDVTFEEKPFDIVTVYDEKIEEILIQKLKEKWPEHKFMGEEEAEINGISELTNDPTWIIDPIDGTYNFIKNLKLVCISVGLVIDKVEVMGVIYNPFLNELYTAIKGRGAYKNGKRIFTTGVTDISKAMFAYEITIGKLPKYYDMYFYRLKHLMKRVGFIRSYGTACMSLCYVADGRLDAYQCDGLFPWDAAAAVVLIREAGGYMRDSRGTEFNLMDPNFIATSTKELSDEFMVIEREADAERDNANNLLIV